tara:strand:- start:336 stop:1442 length:1107 start_codon:yes stop_codon:yes gene_type:complete
MGAIENIQKARAKSMSPEFKLPKSIQERVDNVGISGIREKGISAQELDEYISKGDRLEDIIVRRKGEDPGFTIPERKWGDPGMVIPERRWERDPEHMKKLYELFMERKFGPNWRVRKRHPERMKFGPEQRHPEEMTFEEMPRGDREAPPVSSGWLAKGGRVGLALGGDPYMEDYRDKSLEDPILEPGDEMMPDDAQGIVSQLTNEQDPEKKIMLAIQIIQSMGDRGIEIVESVLSPEEIAMAAQVIQQMDTGADQGIDSIQMAASGGRIGFDNGGSPDDYLLEPGAAQTDPEELIQEIEAQGGLQTAQSTMGNMLMKAMEDSHWMEIGSWLDQYSGFGLGEEDYFNFRTMGPQVKGPEATEGLASVRV